MRRRAKNNKEPVLTQEEHINIAVDLVNKIVESKDYSFSKDDIRNKMSNLTLGLIHSFRENPTFVATIVQFLNEQGFKLTLLRGDVYQRFSDVFNYKIYNLTEEQKYSIKEITAKLFSKV